MIAETVAFILFYSAPRSAIDAIAPVVIEARWRRHRSRKAREAAPVPTEPRMKAVPTVRILQDGSRWIVRPQIRQGIEGVYDGFPVFKEDKK